MDARTVQVGVRFESATARDLDAIARTLKVSRSDLVRMAVAGLIRDGAARTVATLTARAS